MLGLLGLRPCCVELLCDRGGGALCLGEGGLEDLDLPVMGHEPTLRRGLLLCPLEQLSLELGAAVLLVVEPSLEARELTLGHPARRELLS